MKRLASFFLTFLLLFSLTACAADPGSNNSAAVSGSQSGWSSADTSELSPVTRGTYYYDLEHVVLYLEFFDELPDNYITKAEARELGWQGGTPERYLEGSAIGGDTFGNREGKLPKNNQYTECDLNTNGKDSRGAERLVFSQDGRYYYTQDHYNSFTEVWVEGNEVIWN